MDLINLYDEMVYEQQQFMGLEKYGKIAHREMFNIFNMGIGMVIALDAAEAQKAIDILASHGERASVIGRIVAGEGVTVK